MNKVHHIVTSSGTISLMVEKDGVPTPQSFIVDKEHPNHKKVVSLLRDHRGDWSEQEVENLMATADFTKKLESKLVVSDSSLVGKATVRAGQVYVNNVPVHNVISDRIVELASKGFAVDPILRFLELVLENPSSRAQLELYDFLANRALPLTEDGHFLAYKRVRQDWLDVYSGTIDNSVGKVVVFARDAVDDDRRNQCSYGLHVGALEYVRGYGGNGRIVIVKVNPRDCIAVPLDHNAQKLRVCRYEVLYEHTSNEFLESPVYSSSGGEVTASSYVEEESADLDDEEVDRYWENGWGDDEEDFDDDNDDDGEFDSLVTDYKSWSIDGLAAEMQSRGLTQTRQEGRDMGRDRMAEYLAESDLESA